MATAATRRVTKKANLDFVAKLTGAASLSRKVEVEVIAPAYRDIIDQYYGKDPDTGWDFDANTDGFFVSRNIFFDMYLLLEAKDDLNLLAVEDRARVVIQCVYYMKRFEASGHPQPTVIFGGDQDQMFVVYAPPLLHYLEEDHDWTVPPSNAYKQNPQLLKELIEDPILTTFVYDIHDPSFDINEVLAAISSMAENAGSYSKVKISPQNIRVVYDEFLRTLAIGKSGIDARDAVHLFISSLIGQRDTYIDQRAKNRIHLGTKILKLDTVAYAAFFSRYEKDYSRGEVDEITSMYDVLFEETERRFSGDYWTPTIWTDRAHELLTDELGENWRDTYVVWDAACGTKNLTRDYRFEELYVSTIFESELATSTQYNPEGTAFQYDFLNDDIDIGRNALFGDPWKMPPSLYRALVDDKPIVFFMNPPYGTATNDNETSKKGIAESAVNKRMVAAGLKKSAQQLYAQFFYRVVKLKRDFNLSNVVIAFFSNERFMCGGETWESFMADLQEDFTFHKGVFFNAGEFADVSAAWGISFTIWRTDGFASSSVPGEFPLSIERAGINGVEHVGDRVARSIPQVLFLSAWAKEPVSRSRSYQEDGTYVRLSNAFDANTQRSGERGSLLHDAIGYAHNNANDVEHSPKEVGLYSTAFGAGNGFSVLPVNFDRACVNFMVRKSIPASWMNGHENFIRPSEELQSSSVWSEFVGDAIIFALANTSGSNQSALREIDYKGRSLDVLNEWFFLSRVEVEQLATKYQFDELLRDLHSHPGERFVYEHLHNMNLSKEAKVLFEVLKSLVRKTFPFREAAHYADTDRCLQAWDAGFWQLYLVAQDQKLPIVDEYKAAFEDLRAKAEGRVREWNLL